MQQSRKGCGGLPQQQDWCYRDTAALRLGHRTADAWPVHAPSPHGSRAADGPRVSPTGPTLPTRPSGLTRPALSWLGPAHLARLDLAGVTKLLPAASGYGGMALYNLSTLLATRCRYDARARRRRVPCTNPVLTLY